MSSRPSHTGDLGSLCQTQLWPRAGHIEAADPGLAAFRPTGRSVGPALSEDSPAGARAADRSLSSSGMWGSSSTSGNPPGHAGLPQAYRPWDSTGLRSKAPAHPHAARPCLCTSQGSLCVSFCSSWTCKAVESLCMGFADLCHSGPCCVFRGHRMHDLAAHCLSPARVLTVPQAEGG